MAEILAIKVANMNPDTQKWTERAKEILNRYTTYPPSGPYEHEKVLDYVTAALVSVAAEAAHEASQSVVKAVEGVKTCGDCVCPGNLIDASHLAASNYPAPGEK